jgi:YidC/Oxa1 family membrane protein insertase
VPVWGVDILILTVFVRLVLFFPSRKQQIVMAKMQEKMAVMKPEIDKLKEKCGADYQRFNQERTRLMLSHGVNPLSSMGGCLLMFAQMPVFMGLYFCLQESIFFRLESFLWIPNLAAPDMLVWWGEWVPFLTQPSSLGEMYYLGPYFNVLPLLAVTLMFIHQKLSMPPAVDEQQEMQQKMMKYMMIFMGFFFYKMAAGMCLYFIASTSWGLIERRFIKKAKAKALANPTLPPPSSPSTGGGSQKPAEPQEPGFFGKLRNKLEEIQKQAESQRQIVNDKKNDKKKKRR